MAFEGKVGSWRCGEGLGDCLGGTAGGVAAEYVHRDVIALFRAGLERIPEPAAFLKVCEDPSNRSLMEAAKRPPMPMEKSANDAHGALLTLAADAYAKGKFATPEIAYEALLVARSPEIRALVKRARGAP
jgi:hypothetical protein